MKILIDARMYGLENTGIGRYTINLLSELQKNDKKNQYFVLLRKKYFEILNFQGNFEKVLADIPHYSLKEQLQIPKIIKKYNPDLVHFLHFNAPFGFNGKFILTIHDMTMHKTNTNASNLFLPLYLGKHLVYKKVFNHAVLKSQKIIVPSQFVKDELLAYFKIPKEKIIVTHEGVDIKNLNIENSLKINNLKLKIPYLMYVGNVYPHKNLEMAIKAISSINKNGTTVNFYIVCSRNMFEKRLQTIVSKLNAQGFVKFLGHVSDENLGKLYENSVGFLYPSLSEGFGLPGLEAMKAGTLLLASNIPVFKEIYGNHAIYFDPLDILSIKEAIQKALSIRKLDAEKMIRDNREFVKRYSWSKMAKETLAVYNSLNI